MDSILIFPPGPSVAGSQFQLGTYLMWDPGADYGAKGLINSIESSNALRDGGVFGYRNVGPRKMAFPLLLRDITNLTVEQAESLLRIWTTPGAAVAIQPEGIPSGQAVFFDVIDGRWEPDYDGFHNRAGRRKGTLYLDTQPWGYWPTMILLASAASIGGPGTLSLTSTATVIGDLPGLGELFVAPTSATTYGLNMKTDSVFWSFGARPSFQAFWPAGSLLPLASGYGVGGAFGPATLIGDKYAPGSQAIRYLPSSNLTINTFTGMAAAAIPASLEPAYRGRFRLFAFARWGPSQLNVWGWSGDAVGPSSQQGFTGFVWFLASAGPVATLPVSVGSWGTPGGQGPSPAYSLLDLGEVGLPLVASYPNDLNLRLWGGPPGGIGSAFIPSMAIDIGGFYLLPVDGAAGILPRGLNQPTYNASSNAGFQGRFYQAALNGDTFITTPTSVVGSMGPAKDGRGFYRGVLPVVGATAVQLDLMLAGKRVEIGTPDTQPGIRSEPPYAQVSVRYRPTFQFLYGL